MKEESASSVQVNALELVLGMRERHNEDETPIKVHKAYELKKFLLRSGLGELMNRSSIFSKWRDTIRADVVTKEVKRILCKYRLGWVDGETKR